MYIYMCIYIYILYINFFTQICNTTLSRCKNYTRAFPNLDNTSLDLDNMSLHFCLLQSWKNE